MQAPLTLPAGMPRRVRLLLEICWVLIIAKCLAVPWVIAHWQIPVHPGWVIVPTLLFAALVTLLVVTHREN
jgi:membrane protein YdbS with pleckstrin-like domain